MFFNTIGYYIDRKRIELAKILLGVMFMFWYTVFLHSIMKCHGKWDSTSDSRGHCAPRTRCFSSHIFLILA